MRVSAGDVSDGAVVEPVELLTYLRARDWRHVTEYKSGGSLVAALFAHADDDGQVHVPLLAELPDYSRLVAEVVNTVARIERRAAHEVLADLRVSKADVVRVRTPRASGGALPIGFGATLFAATRDLVTAAALGSVAPRAVYTGRRPKRVSEFLDQVMLGQTEPGSFVVRVLVPLPTTIGQTLTTPADAAVEISRPFNRQVTEFLVNAVTRAKEAATVAMSQNSLNPFRAHVKDGVSSELCKALGAMQQEDNKSIEINVAWALQLPRPATPRIELSKPTLEVLGYAAKFLAETEIRHDFELLGYVETMEGEAIGRTEGTVTLTGMIDENLRKVRLTLEEPLYGLAVKAHADERLISVVGELRREGRRYRLDNPRAFAVLEAESDGLGGGQDE